MFNTAVWVSNTQPVSCVLMAQESLVNIIHVRANSGAFLSDGSEQAACQAAGFEQLRSTKVRNLSRFSHVT
jgi:hypothetical protein